MVQNVIRHCEDADQNNQNQAKNGWLVRIQPGHGAGRLVHACLAVRGHGGVMPSTDGFASISTKISWQNLALVL